MIKKMFVVGLAVITTVAFASVPGAAFGRKGGKCSSIRAGSGGQRGGERKRDCSMEESLEKGKKQKNQGSDRNQEKQADRKRDGSCQD